MDAFWSEDNTHHPCTCGKGLSVGNTFHLSFFLLYLLFQIRFCVFTSSLPWPYFNIYINGHYQVFGIVVEDVRVFGSCVRNLAIHSNRSFVCGSISLKRIIQSQRPVSSIYVHCLLKNTF